MYSQGIIYQIKKNGETNANMTKEYSVIIPNGHKIIMFSPMSNEKVQSTISLLCVCTSDCVSVSHACKKKGYKAFILFFWSVQGMHT